VNLSRESLPKLGDRPHICSILTTKTAGSCVGIFDDFAPPYEVSPIREPTIVDNDHPRARAVFELYEQIRQTRTLMGLAGQHGEERVSRLYEELDLGVQGLNDGLTIDDIAVLERECGLLLSSLLEAAIRRQDWLANRPRADDEARLHRIDEQLGGLLNPQGLADRLRYRIRQLQEENRQQAKISKTCEQP
jgi:hypothetical protein